MTMKPLKIWLSVVLQILLLVASAKSEGDFLGTMRSLQEEENTTLAACSTSFEMDDCGFLPNGICDANGDDAVCASGSDCYDCDPCRKYRYTSCETCTGAVEGCFWCPGNALCTSEALTVTFWDKYNTISTCNAVEDWKTSCEAHEEINIDLNAPVENSLDNTDAEKATTGNYFSDPLFSSMDWMYDLVNLKPAWDMGYTGSGVHVRINDGGVDATSPEFAGRFDVENSCENYLPDEEGFSHGTVCASIIGAAANNDACAVGVAPGVTLSSCTMGGDTDEENSALIASSMGVVDISSNSWGPVTCFEKNFTENFFDDDMLLEDESGAFDDDDGRRRHLRRKETPRFLQQLDCKFDPNHEASPCDACSENMMALECEIAIADYCSFYYELDPVACSSYLDVYIDCEYNVLGRLEDNAFATAVTEGRNGLGTIFVFAAGNDYTFGQDVNFDGFINSRYTISVGAVGKLGLHASYSTTGAALLVSAPGGDAEFLSNFIVVNAVGNGGGCFDAGEGTSYACPVVSGILALMLEANPNLNWRDAQGVIVSTSVKTDPEDESWAMNGAGHAHSYKYGFGVIDALAAVNASLSWDSFGLEQQIMVESGSLELEIANDESMTTTSILTVAPSDNFVVESVVLYIDVLHTSRGDLQIELESPSGTVSVLQPSKKPEDTFLQGDERWKLMTVRNFYENPSGNWTLTMTDEDLDQGPDCIDTPFEAEIGEIEEDPIIITCEDMEVFEICEDGEVINTTIAEELIDEVNNSIAATACCACGGGVAPPEVNLLRGWRMIVYGHIV